MSSQLTDRKEEFTFSYKAQNSRGERVEGKIEATSEDRAYTLIRSRGLSPLSVKRADKGLNMEINIPGMKKRAKLKAKAIWAKQFGALFSSGVPLVKALQVSYEQTEDKALRADLEEVYKDVENGSSLASAMEKFPETFTPLMTSLVKVGESGGFLGKTLASIGDSLKSEVELRGKVKAALVYPVIVGVIAVLAVGIMLTFVVPIFVDMFSSMGADLPLPTVILMTISENMIWVTPTLIVTIVTLMVLYRRNKNKIGFKKTADPIKLKIPIFGKILRKIIISRFCRNFAMMLKAGVPMTNALELISATTNSYPFEEAIQFALEEIKKGKSLYEPMEERSDIFPSMLTSMVAVGEENGKTDEMLDDAAGFYEEEVKAATEGLSATIEPLMIVVLGIIVGGMVISLYMPMFSMFEVIAE